eukprot:gene29076-32284_t
MSTWARLPNMVMSHAGPLTPDCGRSQHGQYMIISYCTCVFAVVLISLYAVYVTYRQIISYCTCVFAVVLISLYAVYVTYRQARMRHKDMTTEEFCTARGTQGTWRIAYAFFGSAVGAWVITSPSSFAVWTGIIGLVSYSVSAGLPVLILAFCGALIQAKHDNVLSVGDFVGRRFGPIFKTMTCLICVFVMSIGMLAEYTTIGVLFANYVGSVDFPMVIVVGVLTMGYTAYGGLFASIATDQIQAITIIILIMVLVIYVAVTFREYLPKPLPDAPFPLAPNTVGYGTLFSMPVSLMSATVFSEALWQKVWASKDRKSLLWGGCIGACLITCAVFLFGFGGFLAAWGGLITLDTDINLKSLLWGGCIGACLITFDTDINLYLFQVFADDRNAVVEASAMVFADDRNAVVGASAMVSSWVGVVTLILAIVMNTSAIDSLQNGICSAISTQWFKDQHIIFPRLYHKNLIIIIIIINISLIVIALQNYPVINLFLISNMITTCCFIPVVIGIVTDKIVSESAAIFSCVTAILTALAYGIGVSWQSDQVADSFDCGAWFTFFGNQNFSYEYFGFACIGSIAGLVLWEGFAFLFKLCGIQGPGISGSMGFDLLDYQPFKFCVMGKLHGPLHGTVPGQPKRDGDTSSSDSGDRTETASPVYHGAEPVAAKGSEPVVQSTPQLRVDMAGGSAVPQ